MKYTIILFDLGYTLVDIEGTTKTKARLKELLDEERFQIIVQAFLRWHDEDMSVAAKMAELAQTERFTDEELLAAKEWMINRTFVLYDDVVPMLTWLKEQGVQIGMISNTPPTIDWEQLGIAPYFDAVTWSYEVGVSKPDAKIFNAALKKLNALPQDCLMIGDSKEKDVQGAEAVGMAGLQIDRSGEAADSIHSLMELKEHLLS